MCYSPRIERHLVTDIFGFASLGCQRFKSQSSQNQFRKKGETCKHHCNSRPPRVKGPVCMFCSSVKNNVHVWPPPSPPHKVWFAVLKQTHSCHSLFDVAVTVCKYGHTHKCKCKLKYKVDNILSIDPLINLHTMRQL